MWRLPTTTAGASTALHPTSRSRSATLNASYNFFSSYSFWEVSAGANVKAAYRSIPTVFASGQSAFSVIADIGLLTRFNLFKFYSSREPNLSVGIVARNLGP